jgi:hypothetical protein
MQLATLIRKIISCRIWRSICSIRFTVEPERERETTHLWWTSSDWLIVFHGHSIRIVTLVSWSKIWKADRAFPSLWGLSVMRLASDRDVEESSQQKHLDTMRWIDTHRTGQEASNEISIPVRRRIMFRECSQGLISPWSWSKHRRIEGLETDIWQENSGSLLEEQVDWTRTASDDVQCEELEVLIVWMNRSCVSSSTHWFHRRYHSETMQTQFSKSDKRMNPLRNWDMFMFFFSMTQFVLIWSNWVFGKHIELCLLFNKRQNVTFYSLDSCEEIRESLRQGCDTRTWSRRNSKSERHRCDRWSTFLTKAMKTSDPTQQFAFEK